MKAVRFATVLVALAGIGLAGCNQQPGQPATATSASASNAPAGITVANGRLILPAVSGNPAAVYFDIANNGPADTSIDGASVAGANSATLHMTMQSGGVSSMMEMSSLPLPKGQTVKFAPRANHVMAKGLDASLKPGGTTQVTLILGTGDKLSFPAKIEAVGSEP